MEYMIGCLLCILGFIFGIIFSWLYVKFSIVGLLVGLLVGCLLGIVISWIFVKVRFGNGRFDINETDANKDVYKLTIDDFDKLHLRKYLLVRITRK